MADNDSNSDIDAETLQAQIDMSMAYAQDIVSGWMKASGTSSTVNGSGGGSVASGKKRDVEKELEEMMKRPPRLGVGMTVPDSAGPSGKETAQLKNKLTGKKRRRDDDADSHEVLMNGTMKGGKKDEESDEEESRVGAIRKKAKVDPFAKKVKKKKVQGGQRGDSVNGKEESVGKTEGKGKERDGKSVVTLFEVPSFGAGQSGSGTAGDKMEVDEDDNNNRRPSETVEIVVEANGTGEGKKRKKKRKKNREVGGEEQNPGSVAPATTKSSQLVTSSVSPRKAEKSASPHKSPSKPSKPSGPAPSYTALPSALSNCPSASAPIPKNKSQPAPTLSSTPAASSSTSVLNLTGPPPETRDLADSSTKKKKKRNRKKKKQKGLDGAAVGETADVEMGQPED